MSEYAPKTPAPASNPAGKGKAACNAGSEYAHPYLQLKGDAQAETPLPVNPQAKRRPWQTKLKVGSAHDPAESEADNAAKEVVHGNGHAGVGNITASAPLAARISRMPSDEHEGDSQEEEVQAKCKDCEKEGLQRQWNPRTVQREENDKEIDLKRWRRDEKSRPAKRTSRDPKAGFFANAGTSKRIQQQKGGGQPLGQPVKSQMERGFGANFSKVRIHQGAEAKALNQDLNAKAFTHGKDVFFGEGQYDEQTDKGKELIAHELTHTIQQGATESKPESEVEAKVVNAANEEAVEGVEARQAADREQEEKLKKETKEATATEQTAPEVNATVATPPPAEAAIVPPPTDIQTPASEQASPKAETGSGQVPATKKPTSLAKEKPELSELKSTGVNPLDEKGGLEAPEVKEPVLDTSSGANVIQSISALGPIQQHMALNKAGGAMLEAQTTERDTAETSLPEIMQPTGLGRNDFPDPKNEKPQTEAPVTLKHGGRGGPKSVVDTKHPDPKVPVPGSKIPKAQSKDIPSPWAFGNMLASLPSTDPAVDTSAGPRPPVDLNGDADPNQNAEMQNQADGQMNAEQLKADQEVTKDFGENDMYPTVEPETMRVEKEMGEPKAFEPTKQGKMPEVSPQMVNVWDPQMQKLHQAEFDKGAQESKLAEDDYETKSQAEYENSMVKIDEETDATREKQKEAQDKGKEDVDAHRESWQKENEAVREKYDQDSLTERDRVNQDIDAKVTEANENVEAECKAAETKAENAKKDAEEKAEKEKRDAEEKRKNRSWWQKIGDAIGDFFNALRDLVCKIFDALRDAVKGFIEFAKKAVSKIIDVARNLVVGLIKAFASVLKGLISIALFAFPKLRDKFLNAIDTLVEKTIAVIDSLAQILKDVVFMYLDFLGTLYTALLDIAQGLIMLQLMMYELMITGHSEMLDGIANLYNSASMMTEDMFWDAVMEEMTGQNPGEPLADVEWKDEAEKEAGLKARIEEISKESGMEGSAMETPGTEAGGDQGPVTDVEMDSVPEEEWDPELQEQIANMQDGKEEPLDGAGDPVTMKELAGGETVQEGQGEGGVNEGGSDGETGTGTTQVQGITTESGENPWEQTDQRKLDVMIENMTPTCEDDKTNAGGDSGPMPAESKVGPLSRSMRRSHIINQLTKGITNWLECNWVNIVLILLGVLVVGTILTIVTAGGFLAVLPVIMEVLATIFLAVMLVKMEGHLKDYLDKAWNGDLVGGAKSLAKGLAVGAVELIFNVIFKVGGAIFAAIKAMIKALIKGLVYLIKGAIKVITNVFKFMMKVLKSGKITGSYLVKKGKYVLQGFKKGFGKGAKSIKDLKNRIMGKFKFKKFKVVRKGRWFEVWGEVNPWFLILRGEVKEITDKEQIDQLSKRTKGKNLKEDFKAGQRGDKSLKWDESTGKGDYYSSTSSKPNVKIDAAEVDNVAGNHLGMDKREFQELAKKLDGETYKGVQVIKKGDDIQYLKGDIRVRMPKVKRSGAKTMNLEVKDPLKSWDDIDNMVKSKGVDSPTPHRINVHIDIHE